MAKFKCSRSSITVQSLWKTVSCLTSNLHFPWSYLAQNTPLVKDFPAMCFARILRNKERGRQKTKGSLDTEEIVLMCSRGGAGCLQGPGNFTPTCLKRQGLRRGKQPFQVLTVLGRKCEERAFFCAASNVLVCS